MCRDNNIDCDTRAWLLESLVEYGIRDKVLYMAKRSGGNFCGFRGFSLNRKCLPTNYGLVDWQRNTAFTLSAITQTASISSL